MPVISKKQKFITYFEGDISKYKKNTFGFFNVDVQTKIELNQPILQVKYSTGYGFRTISPLGVVCIFQKRLTMLLVKRMVMK